MLALFHELTMSELHLEVIGISKDYHADYRSRRSGKDYTADTVTITTGTAWQIAIPQENFEIGTQYVLVSNLGPAPVRVAWTDDEQPARYAVVLANAQRRIEPAASVKGVAAAFRVRDI